jgi:hypothetical protein
LTGGGYHALLWTGSASSYVDLHPRNSGISSSVAMGIGDGQQVGYVSGPGYAWHAALWSGTAESFVDLNPPVFTTSWAAGVSGGRQVGYGETATGDVGHALLWAGSANTYVDLIANRKGTGSAGRNRSDMRYPIVMIPSRAPTPFSGREVPRRLWTLTRPDSHSRSRPG